LTRAAVRLQDDAGAGLARHRAGGARADQFPQYVPQNVVTVCTDAVGRELAEPPRNALVAVMTHSHSLDFNIAVAALRRRSFDFVGLIGSETKRARFASFAQQTGVEESDIDRLVCPIGIPGIKRKEPAVIAAALAAQMLILGERRADTPPQEHLTFQSARTDTMKLLRGAQVLDRSR
jgi:xanthine dehydrogenase accessory factor